MAIHIRKARMKDIPLLHTLVMNEANKGNLLPRSLTQLYTAIRDFYVAEDDGNVIGCCALAVIWERLVEVRSLIVADNYRRRGIGKLLVQACIDDAKELGAGQVFTLTYQTAFFATLGFEEVPKETLPQKIWTDCVHCPKFPNCDEIAMLRPV